MTDMCTTELGKLPKHNSCNVGVKYDAGKVRPSLVPTDSLIEIAKVLELGAKKYSPDNWKLVTPHSRYTDAALRHIYAYLMGEKNDPETGLSHLAHASACLMFLIHFELQESKNV